MVYRTVVLMPQQRSGVVHRGQHDFLVGLSVLLAVGFTITYGLLVVPVAAATLLAVTWIRRFPRP